LSPHEKGGEEKEKSDEKKKAISEKVPEHVPARRRAGGNGEATAVNIETPEHVEDEGGEKGEQKNIRDQNRSGQPDAEDQRKAHQQFEPREKERHEVDQNLRKDLIIENDLRERHGMKDLIIAGVNEDTAQEQTR